MNINNPIDGGGVSSSSFSVHDNKLLKSSPVAQQIISDLSEAFANNQANDGMHIAHEGVLIIVGEDSDILKMAKEKLDKTNAKMEQLRANRKE